MWHPSFLAVKTHQCHSYIFSQSILPQGKFSQQTDKDMWDVDVRPLPIITPKIASKIFMYFWPHPFRAQHICEPKSPMQLVMGLGQDFLTQVGSDQFFVAWVGLGHLWFGFEFGKFPLKMSNFSIFFPSDQKKSLRAGLESTQVRGGSASYLLWVKSKLESGQSPSLNAILSNGIL